MAVCHVHSGPLAEKRLVRSYGQWMRSEEAKWGMRRRYIRVGLFQNMTRRQVII